MNQPHSQLDERLAGATNPLRHRARRLLPLLLLAALVIATVAVVVTLVRSVFDPREVTSRPVAATEVTSPEVEVSDQTPEIAPEETTTADDETPAEVEETPAPEPVHASLMMIGDLLMHDGVIHSGDQADGSFNYDHLFVPIADDIAAADLAVLNQETILGEPEWGYSGYPTFNSPQALGDAEADAGFDVVLKATNHTLDMGYNGVRSELAYWHDRHPDMKVIGMADPDSEEHVCPAGTRSPAGPYLFEKEGLRIALLNYTEVFNLNIDVDYDHNVVADLTREDEVRADIAAAKEEADLVVVFTHWGEEYETSPTQDERFYAELLHDAGADVIIGGHPHVIQPVEMLGEGEDRTLVFWSVGNFVSTMLGAGQMVGGMAKVDFVEDADGARVTSYEFVPVVCQRVPRTTAMAAYKLADYTDELAAQNTVAQTDSGNGSTVGWYVDYCAAVLGEAFDHDTLSVHGEL